MKRDTPPETDMMETPLAERMRPRSIDEIIGQAHLLGPNGPLRLAIAAKYLPSIILWGPPGSGKTSLAHAVAAALPVRFHPLSAVLAGVKELREVAQLAHHEPTLLFVDEIHRFNKAQQDALLPYIERGTITLIGATTENPSFEVIGPLLSRTKVYVVRPLTFDHLRTIVQQALQDRDRGLGQQTFTIDEAALEYLCTTADGDARRALNTLEITATLLSTGTPTHTSEITLPLVEQALQKKALVYDKGGEEHYNIISAFIKSLRGSDPDAGVYWLARMLEAGEEPLFVCRRMVIFASEDVGNADPHALSLAVATMQAVDFVGMPEGWIPMAHCTTYLASVPKSNASYKAYMAAKADVEQQGQLPVPLHLRNAPTPFMKAIDYGKGYRYPHNYKDHHVHAQYLPDRLAKRRYYEPSNQGLEQKIRERLQRLKEDPNTE